MAGLLGESWDDPRTQATLQLAAGLLGGGNFGQALGRGLGGYQQSMSAAQEAKMRKEEMDWKRQEIAARQAQAQEAQALKQRQAEWLASQAPADQTGQMYLGAAKSGIIGAGDYFKQMTPKEEEAFTLGEGQVRYKGGNILAQGPQKQAEQPSAVREYEYARGQGYNGTFEQFQTAQKRAGAARTNVNVNTEKTLLNEMASGVGKQLEESVSKANAAKDTLATLDRLDAAIGSKKVMAGPATNPAMYLMQVGTQMGLGGKDSNETLQNTRAAIQAMAQLELDAAGQMKGQGQITEAERALLKRAAGGDITMTVPELKVLSNTSRKIASQRIAQHNQRVKPILDNPNAAPLAPFLTVTPNSGESNVVDFGSLK